jgi:hypothetical protein
MDEDTGHDGLFLVSREAYDSYWPIGPLGYWLIVFLIGIAVLSIVSIGSMLMQDRLLAKIAQGAEIAPEVLEANDSRQLVLSLLELGVIASTGTLFLIWFYRAHRNLHSFGVEGLRYSPVWAVGGFFVPILNLVRPYQVMKEVWWGSDPGPDAGIRRGAPLLVWWWASYLLMNFTSMIAVQLMFHQDNSPAALRTMTQFDIGTSLLTIVAVIFAAGVVREITARQAERWERTHIGQP